MSFKRFLGLYSNSHNYFSKLEKCLFNNDNTRISILLSSIVSTDFYSCDFILSAWLISIMYQIIRIKIACGNIWGLRLCYLLAQSTSLRSHWVLGSNDYQDLCLVSKAQMTPSWVPVYGGTAYCLVFWRWPAYSVTQKTSESLVFLPSVSRSIRTCASPSYPFSHVFPKLTLLTPFLVSALPLPGFEKEVYYWAT